MPELLLELFSEEIPARMQQGAARDLERLVGEMRCAKHMSKSGGLAKAANARSASDGPEDGRG